MSENAFARALQFLNYRSIGKWLAVLASIATAFLFVALLAVLGLFIDLMVSRGELQPYHSLAEPQKVEFLQRLAREDAKPALENESKVWGLPDQALKQWRAGDAPVNLPANEKMLLWYLDLPLLLTDSVGEEAGQQVRENLQDHVKEYGLDSALRLPVQDFGILSLVVRSQPTFAGRFIRFFARWNAWSWEQGNTAYLQGLFFIALILGGLRLGLFFFSNFMAAQAVIEGVTRLRRAIYHHSHRLGTLAFRRLGPSEAVSISTRHVEAVHEGLFLWMTHYFREPTKFVLLITFASLINFWLALAIVLFALLVWLIGGQIAAYFRIRSRRAELQSAEQLSLLQESLMLMRLVKVYLMEQFNQDRVERQLGSYAQAQSQRYLGEAIYGPVFFFLGLFAALVLLFVAGLVDLHGRIGVTTILMLSAILVSLYWPTMHILETRQIMKRSRDSAKTLFTFLDRHGGVGQSIEAEFLPGLSKALEFDKVTLKEPGTGRKLLRGVSLSIQAGQRVAIMGTDEMEKQALVYLIPRFLDPGSGEIRIDGKNLRWVTLDSLRAQTAIVLQHNLVFNDTVANNIGCGDSSYNLQRVIEAAKLAHAHQFIQKLPQGYETPIGEMGHSLKLGELFRIALARAILREPSLLIIEEPHTPLDDDTKSMIDDTLNRVLPGKTVIFLPHRLSTLRRCDRVFLLHHGKIVASGEHREMLGASDLYRHLQYIEFNEFAGMIQAESPVEEEWNL